MLQSKRMLRSCAGHRQRTYFLLLTVILCGVGLGTTAWLLPSCPWNRWILWKNVQISATSSPSAWFFVALEQGSLLLLGMLLLGFSAVGQPGVLVLLCGYGMRLGAMLSEVCRTEGYLWHLLPLLPYYVPLSWLMAVAAREAMRYAGCYTSYGFRDDPLDQMGRRLRLYGIRFLVLWLLLLLLAAAYGLGYSLLQTLFS